MTVAAALPLSTESFNRIMIRITENFDPVIRKKLREAPSIYRNIQGSGPFKLGEGYVRKVHTFFAGKDDQAGLLRWEAETGYRAAGTNGPTDPGVDPCSYKAYMLGYGFKTETYSGWRTARRSPNYCVNDFIYEWEFEQQLAMILDSFGDVGLQVWENFGREMYMNFANKFVATGSLTPTRFTYDPFTSTQITIPAGTVVSTLTPKHLDALHQMLALQAKDGALSLDNDMPVYGLVIHPYDWDDVIDRNTKLREAYLYSSPEILIDGIGKVKKFRGYGMTFDMMAPRFKVLETDASGNLILERVVPFKEEAVTQGSRWEPDIDYLNAEYTLVNVILKNVYEKQVPPVAPGRIGKASFGTTPSNAGELRWINIPDVETNVLEEKGFFFSRFKAFAKPLENSEYAVTMLVKRCPQTPLVLCEPTPDATAGAKTVTAAVAIDEDGDLSYFQVRVTISDANGLLQEANKAITVTFVDASTAEAIVSDDGNAPTEYVLTFATAADWVANGGGIASILSA
jgi:hypothetical protein